LKKTIPLNLLRIIALAFVVAGAMASLGLMLHAGRNNKSILLVLLFAAWVLSPFVGLLVANLAAKRWSRTVCIALYCLMIVLTLGSLVGYSGALSPPGSKPAGVFLIVPLLSWLLIAIVIPVAASRSRRLSRKNDKV
jgi:hypothetical protein